ncbi:MAG: hypothetical protein ACYDC7_03235 [Acidithiobacillus ferrivorans]
MTVESFPHFNGPARQRWESIPANTRQLLLANVWCCQCRYSVTITDFSGAIQDGLLDHLKNWQNIPKHRRHHNS